MPLSIDVTLLNGSYDAAEVDDRNRGEWPPHPARLFCALVAAVRSEADRAALRWLEEQDPPVVQADATVDQARREAYVVTNTVKQGGGNISHPGRTNGLRARVAVHPATPRVTMTWAADPASKMVSTLDAVARRVPYLGRSTGVALVAARAVQDAEPSDGPVFEPCDLLEADASLRVPYPGFLAALGEQHTAGRPAWETARYRGYRLRRTAADAVLADQVVPSVYTDVVIFGFEGLRPDGRLTVRFTEALRSAVLQQTEDAPPALHGHDAQGRPHVAFMALPDVGGEHSDGHLLGLAVAVPDLPAEDRRRVVSAVLGLRGRAETSGAAFDLHVPGLGDVGLLHRPGLVRPWGATPERWRQGSRRWVTATPMVLDRYPKRGRDVTDEIADSARRLGLPEPIDIRVSEQSLQPGAVCLRPHELPRRAKGKLYRHVELVFDRRVSGPVLLGAGRYFGVGLFAPAAPVRTEPRGTHAASHA